MKVVIASFNRDKIIKDKTLKFLITNNILPKEIDIIVETQTMKDNYLNSLGNIYNIIVSDTKGLGEKRNFVRSYYRDETKETEIVQIDDDIDNIIDYDKPLNLRLLIKNAFKECKKLGLCFWGICPFNNEYFIKNRPAVSTNLKLICGGFSGLYIDRKKEVIYTELDQGEDYQFTMEHFLRDGGVLRYNHICIKTNLFTVTGGMCESLGGQENRLAECKENCIYMADRYVGMCSLKIKKRGYDLRLNGQFKIK